MPYSVDANQRELVALWRAAGASVEVRLAKLGQGVPDVLVGVTTDVATWLRTQGLAGLSLTELLGQPVSFNALVEIKTEHGKLTRDEVDWHRDWRGQVAIVRTVEQALALTGQHFEPIPTMARHVAQGGIVRRGSRGH